MTSSFAIPSAVIAISLIACVTDLRTRRIPNVLTFGAAIAGLVVHTALEGTTGALTSGGVLAVVIAFARGYLRTAFANVLDMLRYWRESGLRPVPDLTLDTPSAPRLAYALPMFVGVVVMLWL